MSKDPDVLQPQTSASSLYDRIPGMGGGGLISNLFRHRRPSLFSFRRGQPTAESQRSRLRPQNLGMQQHGLGRFQFHPLPEPPNSFPPYPSYPNPGHYSGQYPDPSHDSASYPPYDSEPAAPPARVPDHNRDHDRDREY